MPFAGGGAMPKRTLPPCDGRASVCLGMLGLKKALRRWSGGGWGSMLSSLGR
jgi:hypothetical protein